MRRHTKTVLFTELLVICQLREEAEGYRHGR